MEEISRYKQPLAAHLGAAQKLLFEGKTLLIYSPPGDTWVEKALERKSNRAVLDQALARLCGEGATWKTMEGVAEKTAPEAANAEADADDPALQHPTIQTALDIFGGTAESVAASPEEEAGESAPAPAQSQEE